MPETNCVPEAQIPEALTKALNFLDNIIVFGKSAPELTQAKGLIQLVINTHLVRREKQKEYELSVKTDFGQSIKTEQETADCCGGVACNGEAVTN